MKKLIFLMILIGILSINLVNAGLFEAVFSNESVLWSFDNDTIERIRGFDNLTINTNAGVYNASNVTGIRGDALRLNKAYLNASNSDFYNINRSETWSINFWGYDIRNDSGEADGGYNTFYSKYSSTDNKGNWLVFYTSNQFGILDSSTSQFGNHGWGCVGEVWCMYTIVHYADQEEIEIYRNGTLFQNVSIAGAAYEMSTKSPLFVINFDQKNSRRGNWTIDEYSFFNDVGLTPNQVSILYNSGSGFEYNNTFYENSQTYNASSYETGYERFLLNITYDSSEFTTVSANLSYNGTEYSSTKSGTGNNALFTSSLIDLGNQVGNNTFYWNISMTNSTGTFYYQSISYNQSVAPIIFGLCNSSLTQVYVNYTFKDEDNLSIVSAKIPASTWEFYIGNPIYNKTYIFSNSTAHLSYAFCFEPVDKKVHVNYSLQYSNDGYPQRIIQEDTSFTNSTTNNVLYLASTSDGIYVTFQVTNTADQPLEDTEVTVYRSISGTYTQISNGFTNNAGAITFWLNPNYIHKFVFVKTGYDSYTTEFYPTNTEYTVQLGGGTSTDDDYTIGISYTITPQNFTLVNDTDYNFSFTIASTYWELDGFGYILTNGSGTYLASGSSTNADGGSVSDVINTASHESMTLDCYYIVNGSYINFSRSWVVYDSAGTGWSIFQFFSNLSATLNSGFFGLDDFGIALITFVFILGFTAALSYKFGITSPAAIMGFIFGFVLFLDIGVGLIPANFIVGAVPHFITILTGIILLGFLIREIQK